jgi:hypothetical protein
MEDKAKTGIDPLGPVWTELQQTAKNNPARAKQLEAMKRVMEENREVLQRLADS